MRQKRGLWKALVPLCVLLLLIAAFRLDGGAPAGQAPDVPISSAVGYSPAKGDTPAAASDTSAEPSPEPELPEVPEEPDTPEAPAADASEPPETSSAAPAASIPSAEPSKPAASGDTAGGTYTCTISISCASILDNMDLCDPEKTELVPPDGWLLPPTEVTFYEGESVFHILQRTCKQQKLHMEYENTPLYGSAYIEGIGNLYEFDAGELSGWMYAVNGWYPNYGCSRYLPEDGDEICWRYTCDLGADIGGAAADQRTA